MAEQGPERLLAGSDRPRPLPPALRARLEEALVRREPASSAPLELPAGARQRLQGRLRAHRRSRKWGALGALGAAAAAVAVIVALAFPGRPGQPVASPSRPAAAPRVPRLGVFGAAKGQPAESGPGTSGRAANRAAGPAVKKPAEHRAAASSVGGPLVARQPAPRRGGSSQQATAQRAVAAAHLGVVSIVPREGPARGGNWVTVRGKGVGNARAVYFGAAPARRMVRVSAGEARVLAPAHAPGTVTVWVAARPAHGYAVTSLPEQHSGRTAAVKYTFLP